MTELRVVVPDEIAERLAARARENHLTPEQLAGEALRSYLGTAGGSGSGRRLSFIGIGRSGGREAISERHDEIIREHFANKGSDEV